MGRDTLGTVPVTVLPTPVVRTPPHHTYDPGPAPCSGGGPASLRVPQGGTPSTRSRSPGPPPRGVRDLRVSPRPPSTRASTPFRGVRDRHAPHHRWCTQDPDLQGPRSATTPHLDDCTPYSDDHAACWGWQDAGAISARPRTIPKTTATPDAMPHSVLPAVFDYCTPVIQGKTTTSTTPCSCTPPLLVTIKGGDGLPLRGIVTLDVAIIFTRT